MTNEIIFTQGANAHQVARFEKNENIIDYATSSNLNFNEFIALAKGLDLIAEFYDVNSACSVKYNGVCAAALGQTQADAIKKIMDSNPIDFMNAIIVTSSEIDSETAKFFKDTNVIAAPKFTKSALEILHNHNIRYVTIKTPLKDYKKYLPEEIKNTPIGTFVQSPNLSELNKDTFTVVSKQKPSVEQIEDAVFAWKVAKHINSQAIVIAKDLKTTAIAQGLQSASVEFALNYSCDMSKDAILASDTEISIHDTDVASQGRIGLIIVPFANKEVVNRADKYGISLITTNITNILY